MRIALIFGIILAILAVVFAFENPGFTDITFFGYSFRILTAALLIASFGTGALIGMLLTLPSGWRSRRRVRVLEKQLSERSVVTAPVVERTIVEDPDPRTRRSLNL
jgi:uncharacterized integral membrane protein